MPLVDPSCLDGINEAFAAMSAGEVARSVIVFED
jgi:Zn-dependent alcohol dehydrogenase